MNTKRNGQTITIELSVEEAALVAAYVGSSRLPAMEELFERLLGSPRWKQIRSNKYAVHPELIAVSEYNAVQEKNQL